MKKNISDAVNKLKAKIAGMDDDILFDVAVKLSVPKSTEERMVRALVCDEYEARFGGESLDILLAIMESKEA